MKKIALIVTFIIPICSCSQVELEIYLLDKCTNQVTKAEFDLFDNNNKLIDFDVQKPIIDSLGVYFLTTGIDIKNNNYVTLVSKEINITKPGIYRDTIPVPKIRFVGSGTPYSNYWNYFNCNKICNGLETDYFENSNKRLEGTFKNGKPTDIKEYWENGNLRFHFYYRNFTLDYDRAYYYDENGDLISFDIHKHRKKKTIVKTFDEKGRLIDKKVSRKYINKGYVKQKT